MFKEEKKSLNLLQREREREREREIVNVLGISDATPEKHRGTLGPKGPVGPRGRQSGGPAGHLTKYRQDNSGWILNLTLQKSC